MPRAIERQRFCKICSKQFNVSIYNKVHCSPRCLQISKNYSRKLSPNYSENIRRANYKRSFGISVEEYDLMVLKQDNKCAICAIHQSQEKRRFAVDHDHKTGKIRGLLCINCNRGIGALKDSSELLEKAIDYLTQKMRKEGDAIELDKK